MERSERERTRGGGGGGGSRTILRESQARDLTPRTHDVPREVISRDDISGDVISCDAISRDAISCGVISCDAISRDAISCDVISGDAIPSPSHPWRHSLWTSLPRGSTTISPCLAPPSELPNWNPPIIPTYIFSTYICLVKISAII